MTATNRILLVDDDEDIANILKRALESKGFNVDAFSDSEQAFANFDPSRYDIAIVDIAMPRLNGFELARKIWQQNEKLQVCFLSAFEINQKEAKATLPSLKSHCFLKKPITIGALEDHIHMHLSES